MIRYKTKTSLAATFVLASAMALAGGTAVTLADDCPSASEAGDTLVCAQDAKQCPDGSYVSRTGPNCEFAACPAEYDDDASAPEAGDTLADGTIYAGDDLSTTRTDASGRYTWVGAGRFCEELATNGHSDWRLPSSNELNVLFKNRAAIGLFDTSGNWYWTSSEYLTTNAKIQRFSEGSQTYDYKGNLHLVRCVR